MKNKNQFYKMHRGVMISNLSVGIYPPPSNFLTHNFCLPITILLLLASLLFTSCGAIAGHFEERTPSGTNINGFNINIRSSGGAGSGAGSRAAQQVGMSTTTNWDSEADFNNIDKSILRFHVQIGDEPERTVKWGTTITSQKRYSAGQKVVISYIAEADVTYTVQGTSDKQTRTMVVARERRDVTVGAAASTQVAFRINDTKQASPEQNKNAYKVKLLKLATPTTGSSRGVSDAGEYVYVNVDDPLSEYFVGNFNNVFNNMYGFTGKLETFAEWVGKEYNVRQSDIDDGFIDCNTLLDNGFLVAGVPLDIDNTHYLQELTDWELFKFYGADFEKEKLGNLGGGILGSYFKLAPFASQDKPAYRYVTIKSTSTNEKIDVKKEFGIKESIDGGRLKLDSTALKLADNANPYDKAAVNPENKKLFDATNSVVGPYYSPREYASGTTLDQNTDGILYLMQDGGKRQMLVYRPETVTVTLDYSNIKNQNYWKDDGKSTRVISVPKNTVITKDDIAKLLTAEAKDGVEIVYTGNDVGAITTAQTIQINSSDIKQKCRITVRYDNNSKTKQISGIEGAAINLDEILEFLNAECTGLVGSAALDLDETINKASVYFKKNPAGSQDIVLKAGKTIVLSVGADNLYYRYENSDGSWDGSSERTDCIDLYLRATINATVNTEYFIFTMQVPDKDGINIFRTQKFKYPNGCAPTKTGPFTYDGLYSEYAKLGGGSGAIPMTDEMFGLQKPFPTITASFPNALFSSLPQETYSFSNIALTTSLAVKQKFIDEKLGAKVWLDDGTETIDPDGYDIADFTNLEHFAYMGIGHREEGKTIYLMFTAMPDTP